MLVHFIRFLCCHLVVIIFGFTTSQVIGWEDWFLHQSSALAQREGHLWYDL